MIEALAAGIAIIATDWRAAAEVLPPNSAGLVEVRNPFQMAAALIDAITCDGAVELRKRFLEKFSEEIYWKGIREAFKRVANLDNH